MGRHPEGRWHAQVTHSCEGCQDVQRAITIHRGSTHRVIEVLTAMRSEAARKTSCMSKSHMRTSGADTTRDVHVRLPEEDQKEHEHDLCGKLAKAMHGTRDAAQN